MAKNLNDKDDARLWQKVTADIKPLSKKGMKKHLEAEEPIVEAEPEPKAEPEDSVAPKRSQPSPRVYPLPLNLDKGDAGGINRKDEQNLKSGKVRIENKLDLHGKTLTEAKAATEAFILNSSKKKHKIVLIITGRGNHGKGVIRQAFPAWLQKESMRKAVVAICQAQPKDGGGGAWYLQLRRGS